MHRLFAGLIMLGILSLPTLTVLADDPHVTAVLDRATKALGGDQKLAGIKAVTWETKGRMTMLLQGPESYHFNAKITVQGLNCYRSETEIDPTGERLKIVSVLNGDKNWFRFGDDPTQPAPDAAALKRTLYLAVIPLTLAPLKSPGFKVEAAGDDKIGGRPASTLKVTCPDGEQIKIAFDKENGLPVKAVGKALILDDYESVQEITYSDYKDFGGIKTASRLEIIGKGVYRKHEITTLKVLDHVAPSTFAAPE